ncbi:MAG TPA: ATP-binding protein [Saprospiraceae bacterium]|nr:ATP-binding protein [Saprospiraceae bacterium]HMT71898.1 ATP-binding protein [Saprospiraceae bacterium]
MRSFVVQVTEEKNIELHFTDNKALPEIDLNMEQRKNIYLICKEAISNAVKYSGCTLLEVLISTENHKLHIHIHDNGKGFNLSDFETDVSGRSFGGNGIKNMKYRAAEIDASVLIFSNPGDGTSIELIAPYKIS